MLPTKKKSSTRISASPEKKPLPEAVSFLFKKPLVTLGVVAALPRIYVGRCPKVAFQSPVTLHP